ncbi:hypothetical protein ECFDA517_3151, partial [Escherichia coli FDA517]
MKTFIKTLLVAVTILF